MLFFIAEKVYERNEFYRHDIYREIDVLEAIALKNPEASPTILSCS